VTEVGVAHDLEVAGVGDHLELEKADLDLELVLGVARPHDHRFVVHGLLLIEHVELHGTPALSRGRRSSGRLAFGRSRRAAR